MKTSLKIGIVLIVCYLVAWLDRMAINMSIPFMIKDLGLNASQIGMVLSSFFFGYSLFQIPGGMLADKFGPKKIIVIGLIWWSIFTALTGIVTGLSALLVIRFLFGMGEGIFPASVWKVLSGWFTKKNRATANAWIISSIALGPALTPLILAPIIGSYGWRTAFYCLGILGVMCVILAIVYIANTIYDSKKVSRKELTEYEDDLNSQEAKSEVTLEKSSFKEILKSKEVWVLFFSAMLYALTIYGWLSWLPTYLTKVKQLDLKSMAMAASVPFIFATIGTVLAGFITDRFMRGRRKLLVIISQIIGGICLFLFTQVTDLTTYMILQCIAGFFIFLGFSAIWTLPMILLPPKLMGSGSGFINTGGQIGGFLCNIIIGFYITYKGGNYAAGFDIMFGSLILCIILVLFGIKEKKKSIS